MLAANAQARNNDRAEKRTAAGRPAAAHAERRSRRHLFFDPPFLEPPFFEPPLFFPPFLPPFLPPFFEDDLSSFFPLPEPLFLPPPEDLLTVAQALRSASFSEVPRFS